MQEDTGSHAASQLPEVGPSDALSDYGLRPQVRSVVCSTHTNVPVVVRRRQRHSWSGGTSLGRYTLHGVQVSVATILLSLLLGLARTATPQATEQVSYVGDFSFLRPR